MDFLDIENYDNLINIHKLNKQIHLLNIEINEFESKKKSNIYFLNIQKDIFNELFLKKENLLKKYNCKIIKNILNMHFLKKKVDELILLEKYNNNLIINYRKQLKNYNIQKYNTKINIDKLLLKYNNILINCDSNKLNLTNDNILLTNYNELKCKLIKNLDNPNILQSIFIKNNNESTGYNLFNIYLLKYNLNNDFNVLHSFHTNIYKQFILLKILNLEFKEYLKVKSNYKLSTQKVINNIQKNNIMQIKHKNKINLLYKKTQDIKNKYLYLQKDIMSLEAKNLKTQSTMNKNIHELNIRISFKKKLLEDYQADVDKYNDNIFILNNTKGELISNNEQCSICLDDIKLGITTECKHHFHYGCINLYIFNILQQNTKLDIKCPLCRQYI